MRKQLLFEIQSSLSFFAVLFLTALAGVATTAEAKSEGEGVTLDFLPCGRRSAPLRMGAALQ
jgi:hypothetical protein